MGAEWYWESRCQGIQGIEDLKVTWPKSPLPSHLVYAASHLVLSDGIQPVSLNPGNDTMITTPHDNCLLAVLRSSLNPVHAVEINSHQLPIQTNNP